MRRFYQHFSKRHSLSDQLSWTHYRHLLKLKNEPASLWYMKEGKQQMISNFSFLKKNPKEIIKEIQEVREVVG